MGLKIFVSYVTEDSEKYNINQIALGLEKYAEIEKGLIWEKDIDKDITSLNLIY